MPKKSKEERKKKQAEQGRKDEEELLQNSWVGRPDLDTTNHEEKNDDFRPTWLELSEVLYLKPSALKINHKNQDFFKKEDEDYFNNLQKDIEKRGILVPLIAKTDGTLLAGQNRLEVAIRLGLEKIPVQQVTNELDEKQEQEFIIKDNLLRRQLTKEDRRRLIEIIYGFKEIIKERRGGDRRSEQLQSKGQDYTFENHQTEEPESIPLHQKVVEDFGVSEKTAKSDLAVLRRQLKPENENKLENISENQIPEDIQSEIKKLEADIEDINHQLLNLKQQRQAKQKQIKNLIASLKKRTS